jgi:hypothetical protein
VYYTNKGTGTKDKSLDGITLPPVKIAPILNMLRPSVKTTISSG